MKQLKLFALLLTAWTVSLYSADGAGGGAVAAANSQVKIKVYPTFSNSYNSCALEVSNTKSETFMHFFLPENGLYLKKNHIVNNNDNFNFDILGSLQLSTAQTFAFLYACDQKSLPVLTASDITTLKQSLEELMQAHNNFNNFAPTQLSNQDLQLLMTKIKPSTDV